MLACAEETRMVTATAANAVNRMTARREDKIAFMKGTSAARPRRPSPKRRVQVTSARAGAKPVMDGAATELAEESAPGGTRTLVLRFGIPALCPLSYGRASKDTH